MVEALGMKSIYAPPPFLLGGRHPLETGKRPHLAEIYPQIAAPQSPVISQIQAAIRAGQSVVILGIPGVGKSQLCYEMRRRFKIPPENFFCHSAAPFLAAVAEEKAIAAASFFFDDLEHVARRRENFAQAIRDGFQLVFFNPPAYENLFADFIHTFALQGRITIFILPPANFSEFQASILSSNRIIHYYVPDEDSPPSANIWRRQEQCVATLSPASIKTLFDLTGGNYGQALEILEKPGKEKLSPVLAKILSGAPAESIGPEEMDQMVDQLNRTSLVLSVAYNNFIDYLPLLREYFFTRPLPAVEFWKKDAVAQALILRLLQYGLLALKEGSIGIRGQLLERAIKKRAMK